MKKLYKFLMLTLIGSISFIGCTLEENPPFLASDNIYSTAEGAEVALTGAYSTLTNHFLYGADYHHLERFTSGFFVSKRAPDNANVAALSPLPSQNYVQNLWKQSYQAISRANDVIANIPDDVQDAELGNVLGQAYFLRAHLYLNLVRLYGGVPLRTEMATAETLHLPRASVSDVYDLIISDATKASNLLFDKGMQKKGRPANLAAQMILAKTYMTLAGNDNSSPYWQLAYDSAIQLYGQYSLVQNYGDLWNSESTANNNSESIFEVQFNEEVPSKLGRLFTPSNAFAGNGWERIKPNPETVDAHMDRYPNDPRIGLTFISTYAKYPSGTIKVYPDVARTNAGKGYPYLYKYFMKDVSATVDATNFNYRHFRYGDLLLMLAEIENELGKTGDAHAHVNEVLTRARNSGFSSEPANWSGLSQDEFRTAIMKEYQFELLGEGQDWFNNHRRGYDYFKTNIIDVHNARVEKGFDVVYPENEKVMLNPIPSEEINSNQQISQADQNPGY